MYVTSAEPFIVLVITKNPSIVCAINADKDPISNASLPRNFLFPRSEVYTYLML